MLALLVLSWLRQDAIVDKINALAKERDTEGLAKYAASGLDAKSFQFLRTGGAYGSGTYGWTVLLLPDAASQERYLVFTTKITGEDLGAQVFRFDGSKMTAKIPELETFGFAAPRHAFDISFDIEQKSVKIVDSVDFLSAAGGKSLQFRLSPQYIVSKVVNSSGANVKFSQAGGVVSVAAQPLKSFTYTITYGGVVDLPGFAASISTKEATLTNDFWWPQIARAPATYTATVHGPKDWTVIGQGAVTNEEPGKWTVKMDLPTSVFSLTCGPYRSVVKEIAGRKYAAWSQVASNDAMAMQAELNAPILDFYSRTFAPYPFPQWGTLESPTYGGGALEAYSYATYGAPAIATEDPHEPAHTWWGGIIPNTYLRSMWNESFAVFSQGFYEREGGPPEFEEKHRVEREQAFVSDAEPTSAYKYGTCATGSCETGGVASSLGYGKGADVLQALEAELGVETMKKTLTGWVQTHQRGKPGEWEDYEAVVNKVTGKECKWFFDQWIRRAGWPSFDVTDVKWAAGKVTGKVKFEGESYRLSLEVMLQFADGTREFLRTDSGNFEVASAKKPALVSVDPWRKLLHEHADEGEPTALRGALRGKKIWVEPGREDWTRLVGRRSRASSRPSDAADTVWIAHPEKDSIARTLCDRVGFKVQGSVLTYDGTTIDLEKGAAAAVIDLAEGKQAVIALGKTRRAPQFGRARLVLVDDLGRVLRAKTDPKTEGWGVVRL